MGSEMCIRDRLRKRHVERLGRMECTPESGMLFVDILTDLERVSDHATNIMYAAKESVDE